MCTLCCVAARCSQTRWRNVAYTMWYFPTVGSRGQSFTRGSGWNGGHDCHGCWTSASLVTAIICISGHAVLGCKSVRGERMKQVNGPGKWHLRDMMGPEWEHCRCLPGIAGGTWLVTSRKLIRWRYKHWNPHSVCGQHLIQLQGPQWKPCLVITEMGPLILLYRGPNDLKGSNWLIIPADIHSLKRHSNNDEWK